MKFNLLAASAALSALALSAPASAQTADPLAQCLQAKTTDADRTVFVRWMFVGMAGSKAVREMANVSDAQREAAMRSAGALIERLLTVDCRAESIARMKGDPEALKSAFGKLGESAMENLMRDPAVAGTFAGIVQYVDMSKLVALMVEAGALGARK